MESLKSTRRSEFSTSNSFKFLNNSSRDLKSPNSPLIKSPYIKLKLEGKNLEKSLINSKYLNNEKQNVNIFLQNISRYFVSLTPFVKITLNNQTHTTKAISHNSPVWLDEFELEIKNLKLDRIVIELFTKNLLINNFKNESEIKENNNPIFLGFQILPIKYLERTNKIGEKKTIWLRLITKKQEEYFVEDKSHVMNVDNHDPDNYKIDENLIKKEKDIGVPLIRISFEYINFFHLWLLNCSVHSIIRKEDPKIKKNAIYYYRLYIKRNDNLEWFKEVTFEEIEKFRNSVVKFVREIENIPFPMKSIFSYVPFIGSYYSDENNDVLIEKKIVLDNFFEQVCLNFDVYKLEVFNSFFKEN